MAEVTECGVLALDYLAQVGSTTVDEIQEQINVLPAQVARVVRQLQSAGFVSSDINPQDRRGVDVSITDEGRAVHSKCRQAKLAPIIASLEGLGADERSQFMGLVRNFEEVGAL